MKQRSSSFVSSGTRRGICGVFGVVCAVGLLIVHSMHAVGSERTAAIAMGLVSIIVSWAVVHTTFMVNYACQYYGTPEGGIDFGTDRPTYADFAYLAFTVGMTFQVCDTALQTPALRRTLLKQALLSYVFGTAIIAASINLLAGLAKLARTAPLCRPEPY